MKIVKTPELILGFVFSAVFLLGYSRAQEICYPNTASASGFAFNYYLAPTCLAMIGMALVVGLKSVKTALLTISFCFFSIFIHFNLKSWTPLINPSLHDATLHGIDSSLGVFALVSNINAHLYAQLGTNQTLRLLGDLYHSLFLACFFLAFLICTVWGGLAEARRLNFSICTVLLLGGVLYWALPAVGSFIYAPIMDESQLSMLKLYAEILTTGKIPEGYFLQGLAAMPSLHLAHATVFAFHVFRCKRFASVFFFCVVALFVPLSILLGWHYSLDIVAGISLGLGVSAVAARMNFSAANEDISTQRKTPSSGVELPVTN